LLREVSLYYASGKIIPLSFESGFARLTWRLAAPLGHMDRAQPHEPRQRCPLHRLVRRPGAWQDGRHPLGTPRRRSDSRARDSLARPAVIGTHGHATPVTSTRAARDSPAPNGPGTTGRHPSGHAGPRSNRPSSERATTSRARHGVIRAVTPRASVGSAAHYAQLSHWVW